MGAEFHRIRDSRQAVDIFPTITRKEKQMSAKLSIEEIARAAYEINRAYCEALGDRSQLQWEEAPEWQKKSMIAGVEFHLDNPAAGPSASHDSWVRMKVADGWKFGPVKDVEKKEHPCCVEYHELPQEQKAKDYIFRAVVHALS